MLWNILPWGERRRSRCRCPDRRSWPRTVWWCPWLRTKWGRTKWGFGNREVRLDPSRFWLSRRNIWLWTKWVNTNGAAAKVVFFWQIWEIGTPWHFWEDKSRLTGVPKSPSVKKHKKKCSGPTSAELSRPFPKAHRLRQRNQDSATLCCLFCGRMYYC